MKNLRLSYNFALQKSLSYYRHQLKKNQIDFEIFYLRGAADTWLLYFRQNRPAASSAVKAVFVSEKRENCDVTFWQRAKIQT